MLEKAKSKSQQRMMGMALAYKRGELKGSQVSDQVKKMADTMSEKDLEDYAKTKHDNLPDSVDEAMSMQQRRKASIRAKRYKAKLKIGAKKARNRVADAGRIKKRANRAARTELLKKLTKGKAKSELSYSRRQSIEKRLDAMKGRLARIAKKKVPEKRRAELSRRRGG